MALQEDDRLWEHLQGKSREELLGLLEQIMKKQPEIKGLLKLLLELPLTSGARAEHKAGVGRVRTLEPATIQARIRAAFAQAGHAWGYSMLAATDLYREHCLTKICLCSSPIAFFSLVSKDATTRPQACR